MRRVLVITYYWPPSGGAGVQRWLKFVKYLRDYGWEPVVYTPENPEPPVFDETLLYDVPEGIRVIKRPIREPYLVYKRLTGQKKSDRITAGFLSERQSRNTLAERVSVWVRGNLFIPDARKFWIRPSVRFLRKWLAENPVDAMVTNGPPHSMHLIGLGVKQNLGIPWLADFRDPWTGIDFYDRLMLTSWADRKHHRMERMVLEHADMVTTVSPSWADDLGKLASARIRVVTNGFDEKDFLAFTPAAPGHFDITHIGSLNSDRNPEKLWEVLAGLHHDHEAFRDKMRIRFIGKTDARVLESLARNGLTDAVEIIGYLPHREVLEKAASSAVLLLPLNNTPNVKGIIPGKIFEYLAARRPILCIGPEEGDSAAIIRSTGAGQVAGFSDREHMKWIVESYFRDFSEGLLNLRTQDIRKYSRRELTGQMAGLLDGILKQNKDGG
ncbi:MAG: glycosyltransferase family 4 protein [Bacteroidales bacterium]|nr:glycosyltransferase family 4 protein [Bacteroidales bacterium]